MASEARNGEIIGTQRKALGKQNNEKKNILYIICIYIYNIYYLYIIIYIYYLYIISTSLQPAGKKKQKKRDSFTIWYLDDHRLVGGEWFQPRTKGVELPESWFWNILDVHGKCGLLGAFKHASIDLLNMGIITNKTHGWLNHRWRKNSVCVGVYHVGWSENRVTPSTFTVYRHILH